VRNAGAARNARAPRGNCGQTATLHRPVNVIWGRAVRSAAPAMQAQNASHALAKLPPPFLTPYSSPSPISSVRPWTTFAFAARARTI
jgi:hypothetical protein